MVRQMRQDNWHISFFSSKVAAPSQWYISERVFGFCSVKADTVFCCDVTRDQHTVNCFLHY